MNQPRSAPVRVPPGSATAGQGLPATRQERRASPEPEPPDRPPINPALLSIPSQLGNLHNAVPATQPSALEKCLERLDEAQVLTVECSECGHVAKRETYVSRVPGRPAEEVEQITCLRVGKRRFGGRIGLSKRQSDKKRQQRCPVIRRTLRVLEEESEMNATAKPVYTDEQREEAARLIREGFTNKEIADRLQVTWQFVGRVKRDLRAAGETLGPPVDSGLGYRPPDDPDDVPESPQVPLDSLRGVSPIDTGYSRSIFDRIAVELGLHGGTITDKLSVLELLLGTATDEDLEALVGYLRHRRQVEETRRELAARLGGAE